MIFIYYLSEPGLLLDLNFEFCIIFVSLPAYTQQPNEELFNNDVFLDKMLAHFSYHKCMELLLDKTLSIRCSHLKAV